MRSPIAAITTIILCLLLSGCLSSSGSSDRASTTPAIPTDPTEPTLEITSYLASAGVGVSDLDAALAVYVDGMQMREISRIRRDNRLEVTLESADARGSHLTLMQYTDGVARRFDQNPGKLVFYARDPQQFAADFSAAGGRITVPPAEQPAVVGFGRDPDNNLVEIVGDPQASHSYFGAFGLGVSNLEDARDFYIEQFGLVETMFLQIPGQYDEYILESPIPGSSALVLMHWTNGSVRNYQGNPIKLEFASSDPERLSHALDTAGAPLLRPFARAEEQDLNGLRYAYAEDADETLLELRQGTRGYLNAAAVGTDDLDAALRFYTDGLAMTEVARYQRENRNEVVLQSADARGSQLVLMEFTDGVTRNMRQNPGKLVFYVKDPQQFALDLSNAGGRVTVPPSFQPSLNVTVGFARDPDNNLVEFVGSDQATHSYFGAFGIGVSNLQSARDFYVKAFGLREILFLPIPGQYDEYILQGQGGSALVLMHWTNAVPRNYTNNPVKLEWRNMSPGGLLAQIDDNGGQSTSQPAIDAGRDGELVAYAKDADGTIQEVLLAPWGQ